MAQRRSIGEWQGTTLRWGGIQEEGGGGGRQEKKRLANFKKTPSVLKKVGKKTKKGVPKKKGFLRKRVRLEKELCEQE